MPTHHDETLLQRYQREHRVYEEMKMSKNAPSRLIYVDASDAQVRWGSNDDPRGILEPGKAYEVASVDVRSSHTKVELVEFPGKRFNSVCFKQVDGERDRLSAINAELIEVLKLCKDHISGPTAWTQEQEDLLLGMVSAAIAKAQGEQP